MLIISVGMLRTLSADNFHVNKSLMRSKSGDVNESVNVSVSVGYDYPARIMLQQVQGTETI